MRIITLDAETYYSKDYTLSKMTIPEYLTGSQYETVGWAVIDGIGGEPQWFEGDSVAKWLENNHIEDCAVLCHNTSFDGSILAYRYGLYPKLYLDTMAMSRALLSHELPGGKVSLDNVTSHLGIGTKGKTVHKVMGMHLAEIKAAGFYDEYVEYSMQDARLCRDLFLHLFPRFPGAELKVIDSLVRMVTDPQFVIDRDILAEHLVMLRAKKATLLERCGLSKLELMSNDKFALALERLGVTPPTKISDTTGEETWAFAKTDKGLQDLAENGDEDVQALVAARLGHKSTLAETRAERFIAIHDTMMSHFGEPIMPIALNYHGAHTGRFSGGWKLNQQNLPSRGDTTLRQCLLAPDGYTVVACDSSQVEARVSAWLCKQRSLLDAFEQKRDVYCEFGSALYGRPITKADKTERFLSKTAVLGLQYGLGHAKFYDTVRTQIALQGFDMEWTPEEAQRVVNVYRNTYANIRSTWSWLGDRLNEMVNGGACEGERLGPCVFEKDAILLPNDLRLHYWAIERQGPRDLFCTYAGRRKRIYGPMLLENITQALARVIIVDAALQVLARTGRHMSLQVHDEIVYVVPDDEVESFSEIVLEEMRRRPVWALDLPLDAELGTGKNYGECK